jgi:energy-converting hydrogenase Eha subunit B
VAARSDVYSDPLSILFGFAGTLGALVVAVILVIISKGTLAFTPQAAAPYAGPSST